MNLAIVDARDPDPAVIGGAAAVLVAGGVVAYPTETLYGLAVDPRNDQAVRRLFDLKQRDARSPIALIAADLAQAKQAGSLGDVEMRLAAAFWPGPLTIVVRAASNLSPSLLSDARTIGVRVSPHPVARDLARAFGGCITATSANVSGRSAASTASQVAASFGDLIDLLIDAGPTSDGPPSTVVEVAAGVARLHRVGAIAWDRVLESLQ